MRAALRAKRRKLLRLLATVNVAERLRADVEAAKVELVVVEASQIEARVPGDATHQGVLLEARPLPAIGIEDLPEKAFVLVLDQITDPHNVGAILRTAAAFGLDGVITTERHSPAMSGVLAKIASGGLEYVPICTVVNLARAMEALEDRGFVRVGLDSEASNDIGSLSLNRPLALVLGAEGKGLRRLTRENCDVMARLDLPGPIKSLNVSNACAAVLALVAPVVAPPQAH